MDKPNQVKPEYLLQKIGEMTILRDIEAAAFQQKIQMLENTVKELTEANSKKVEK